MDNNNKDGITLCVTLQDGYRSSQQCYNITGLVVTVACCSGFSFYIYVYSIYRPMCIFVCVWMLCMERLQVAQWLQWFFSSVRVWAPRVWKHDGFSGRERVCVVSVLTWYKLLILYKPISTASRLKHPDEITGWQHSSPVTQTDRNKQ